MTTLERNLLRRFKDLRHGLFYTLIIQRNQKTLTLGGQFQWTIQAGSMCENSIVYSAGAGGDISFEKELITRFGCHVILLDPSPTGVATMNRIENQVPKLLFERVGLAALDGTYSFEEPENPQDGSYRIRGVPGADGNGFPCLSLPTLMHKYGHDHVDLLKIDIEGAEYGVLEEICTQKLPIRQICVEFHHSIVPGIRRGQTIWAIVELLRCGYKLIHRKDWDHTFVKISPG